MIHALYIPLMGTRIVKLEVVEWLKSPGRKVNKGEDVLILRSGKGYFDLMYIEFFHNGYLAAILVQAGETVALGEVAALIAETKEEIPLAQEQAQKLIEEKFLEELKRKLNSKKLSSSAIPSIKLTHKIKTSVFEEFYIENKPKGLTKTGLLLGIVAEMLAKYPLLNARLTQEKIKYSSTIDINIPVYLIRNKTVFPTVFDVAQKDLLSLSRECLKVADRAIKNQLKPEQYDRGNITIINLEVLGVDRFDTALCEGQSCIITFGCPTNRVITNESAMFKITKQMNLSLTCDRRIISSDLAARFLRSLAWSMENIRIKR